MGIFKFTIILCLSALLYFAGPLASADSSISADEKPKVACGQAPMEDLPAEEPSNEDQLILPRIEDPEVLLTLSCIQAEQENNGGILGNHVEAWQG